MSKSLKRERPLQCDVHEKPTQWRAA